MPLFLLPLLSSLKGFLVKNWKLILIGVILLSAYLYVKGLQNTVEEQEDLIARLELNNSTLKANVGTLKQTIIKYNKTIDVISANAKQTEKDFSELQGKIKKQEERLKHKLHKIITARKPSTCQETIKYLIDARKEYEK